MASKKRGGLSKRELAASQKAKSSSKSSSSSRAVASKSPWGSAGDAISGEGSMTNTQYENKIAQGLGAKTAALARNEAQLTSNPLKQREAASKAYKSKSSSSKSSLSPSSSVQAAEASGLLGTQSRIPNADTLSGESATSNLVKGGRKVAGGILSVLKRSGGATNLLPDLGVTEKLGINDFFKTPTAQAYEGTPQVMGVQDMSPLGRALQEGSSLDMPNTAGGQEDVFGDLGRPTPTKPFSDPTYQSSGSQNSTNNNNKKKDWVNPWGDVDISGEGSVSSGVSPYQPTQEEISQLNNENNDGGNLLDTSSGTVGNPSGRGSGKFGTGKGVMSDDPYIKELRKAYSSNGGEKWLRKQFEELISALDPTYAALQKEGTDALNQQLNTQNNQLASVMNANNTGDSEQRAQLMAQQQQGTQTAIGNLLAKLAQNKAQDVSGYRSQMSSALAQNADKQQTNRQRLMEQIQQYRNNQFDQQYKNASLAQKGSGDGDKEQIAKWGTDPITGERIYTYNEIDPLTGKKIMYDSEGQPFTN